MRGLFALLLVVIVTVDTVRSQGAPPARGSMPPTKTKKGVRPSRRSDNLDIGMPSGKDIPDGMRFPGGVPPWVKKPAPAAAAVPAAPAAPMPVVPAAPAQAIAPRGAPPALPPTRTKTAAAGARRPLPSRRSDNLDIGMPSGKDIPDGMRFPGGVPPWVKKPAPAPAPAGAAPPPAGAAVPPPAVLTRPAPAAPALPPTKTKAGRRFNDNPDWGLPSGRDYPDAGLPVVPPPQPKPQPQPDCTQFCNYMPYAPVCGYFGNYDNECWLYCNNDQQRPCNIVAPPPPAAPLSPCQECAFSDHDPVCDEDGQKYRNECEAKCEGVTKYYSCPPTP